MKKRLSVVICFAIISVSSALFSQAWTSSDGNADTQTEDIWRTGNVGIGPDMANPLGKLHLSLGGWMNVPSIIFNQIDAHPSMRLYRPTGNPTYPTTSYVWWIENSGSLGLNFKTGPIALIGNESVSAKVTFANNGNVGIGTVNNPNDKLEVVGNIRFSAQNGKYGLIQNNGSEGLITGMSDQSGFSDFMGVIGGLSCIRVFGDNHTTCPGNIQFLTNGSIRTIIDETGNVGIGPDIVSPLGKLHLSLGGWMNVPSIIFNQIDAHPSMRLYRPTGNPTYPTTSYVWWIENSGSFGLNFKTGPIALIGSESVSAKVTFANNGRVGIGTTSPVYPLDVVGTIRTNGLIKADEIQVTENGADFVFEPDYDLPTLEEVEFHINQHKHLPDIPSAEEMQVNGVNMGEMQTKLLQKIEELTLYVIDLKKENQTIINENNQLKERVAALENND